MHVILTDCQLRAGVFRETSESRCDKWHGEDVGLICSHRIHCTTVYVDTAITRMLGLMNGKDSFGNDKVPPQTRMLGPAVRTV